MRRLILVLLLVSANTLIAQVAPTPATNPHPYAMLYVFGDSYSDSGAGYVDGNGPTAVVYLAQRLGIPFTYYGDPGSVEKGSTSPSAQPRPARAPVAAFLPARSSALA